MAHNDSNHLEMLILSLGKNAEIFIHIDGYVDINNFIHLNKYENVHFIKHRIKISWGGISIVDAMLKLLNMAINMKLNCSHYIFLSGSCYPIKPIKQLENFLSNNLDKSFIKYINLYDHPNFERQIRYRYVMENPFPYRNKITYQIHRVLRRISIHLKRSNTWNKNYIPYGGSQWIVLNQQCSEYVIYFHEYNPWFREMFKNTYAPDEHYIHTILGNSNLNTQCTGLQDFQYFGLDYLANLHLIDNSLTKWYTINDWDEIIQSDKFFVRKVRTSDGTDLIERLNKELLT